MCRTKGGNFPRRKLYLRRIFCGLSFACIDDGQSKDVKKYTDESFWARYCATQ